MEASKVVQNIYFALSDLKFSDLGLGQHVTVPVNPAQLSVS